jgi:enediyne biosynthesis protein E4
MLTRTGGLATLCASATLGVAIQFAAAVDGPTFVDIARSAGLTHTIVFGGSDRNTYILETTGTGVAFFDYDADGVLDLLFTNGATIGHEATAPSLRLYRGDGSGAFIDVTDRAGVSRSGWGQGVAVADYDNDGFEDIYLTFFGKNVLFHNNRNGTFSDVTARAGVAAGGWSTSAAWFDYDNDRLVDLFVARYIDFSLETAPRPGAQLAGVNCSYRGFPVMCGPRGLKGMRDMLFRNNGDGTFTDVTERAGIDASHYRGLGVVSGDYNNDGKVDLFVANDAQPNQLYRNHGGGRFEETALGAGVAVDEDGRARAGMGVDFGDYDNDGWLDLTIGNFFGEPCSLYRNQQDGTFVETTWSSRIGPPTIPILTWGSKFLDYDNDGWKDVVYVNGHVYPEVDAHNLDETYAQRPFLFRNGGKGTFTSVGGSAGLVWNNRWAARGAAIGDFDNDGDVDIAVAVVNGPPILLRNNGESAGHWVTVSLQGTTSNRDAIGARLTVRAGLRTITEEVGGGGSYLSQSDRRIHIGVGEATRIDTLEVAWPSGTKDRVGPLDVDAFITIKEGSGAVSGGRSR